VVLLALIVPVRDGRFDRAMNALRALRQPREKARLAFVPFLALALLFAGTDWLTMRRVSQLRAEAVLVEERMLADIDLVRRMQRDLDRVKLLTDRHVFERESAAMEQIEGQIARARANYAAAVAEYESKPLLPAERAPLQSLKAAVAEVDPRVAAALEASRRNDDLAAYRVVAQLEGDWDAADHFLLALANVNREAAGEGQARVLALQGSWTSTLQALALTGVALSLVLGAFVTRGLQHRTHRLEDINRELDAFSARVAHDLRGPLATATLAASRLSTLSPSSEQQKPLGILRRAFGRMNAVIEDLLALSRAQVQDPDAVCNPMAAAEQLREDLASRASAADARLVIDVEPARVRCTEGLLRQVMWNLADNALKYRRPEVGLSIEIHGHPTDHRYDLSVQDNGAGLSPEEMDRVFDPFYRGAGSKGEPGTGLGLSIVKRAVEASGGTVCVISELGSGSTFVARLPLA
jgi:signal transduction histidine kinase